MEVSLAQSAALPGNSAHRKENGLTMDHDEKVSWLCERCKLAFTSRKKKPCPECGSYGVYIVAGHVDTEEGQLVAEVQPFSDFPVDSEDDAFNGYDPDVEDYVEDRLMARDHLLLVCKDGDFGIEHMFEVIDQCVADRGSYACPKCRQYLILEGMPLDQCDCWKEV